MLKPKTIIALTAVTALALGGCSKGEHLKSDDSRDKIALGQAWRNAAGSQFRYYMVFADGAEPLPGAVGMKQFVEVVKEL